MARIKWIKCTWVITDVRGHVSMNGFTERTVQVTTNSKGRRVNAVDAIGHDVTVTPVLFEMKHDASREILKFGEFIVQDSDHNRDQLKTRLNAGQIELDDVDLENDIMDSNVDRSEITIEAAPVSKMVIEEPEIRKGSDEYKLKMKNERKMNLTKAREKVRELKETT